MTNLIVKIVGSFFRPPAVGIVKSLEVGDVLKVVREPEDPHDGNAVAVWLDTDDVGKWGEERVKGLEAEIGLQGTSIEEFFQRPSWHLGYLPREVAAQLTEAKLGEKAQFIFTAEGKPGVRVEVL